MKHLWYLRTIIIIQSTGILIATACTMKDFTSCAIQLSSKNVPFDTNMVNVVFNITSEAKLLHVCRAYSEVIPCFRQRLRICGDDEQQQKYDRAVRLHSFLCSPFSLPRQKILLRDGDCIVQALERVKNCTCKQDKDADDYSYCELNDKKCNEKQQLAKHISCRSIQIKDHCGREAATFFADMHTAINNERLHNQCIYEGKNFPDVDEVTLTKVPLKKPKKDNVDSPLNSLEDASNYLATSNVPQATNFYKNLKSKTPLIKSLSDIPILSEKNGKLVPNPELSNRFAQLFTEMQNYAVETNDKASLNKTSTKPVVNNSFRTVKVRENADTFTNMFRPMKMNLKKNVVSVNYTNSIFDKGSKNNSNANSIVQNNNSSTNNEQSHPLWLHGTRPHTTQKPISVKIVQASHIRPVIKDNGVFVDKTKQHSNSLKSVSRNQTSTASNNNRVNSTNVFSSPLKPHNDIPEQSSTTTAVKMTTTLSTASAPRFIPWYYKSRMENEVVNAIVKNITEKFMENRAKQNSITLPNYSTGNLTYAQKYNVKSYHFWTNLSNGQCTSPNNHTASITRVTIKAPTKMVSVENYPKEKQLSTTTTVPIRQTVTAATFSRKFNSQQPVTVKPLTSQQPSYIVQTHLQPQHQLQLQQRHLSQQYSESDRKINLVIEKPQNDHLKIEKLNQAPATNVVVANPAPLSAINSADALRSQPESVDLNELKKVANSYFSTAFKKLKHNAQQFSQSLAERTNSQLNNNMSQNPWNQLLSLVAPAVEKVSPGVLQRIKQGISQLTDSDDANIVS